VKEQQQNPERYGKYVRLQDGTAIQFAMIGQYKGFSLKEIEDEGQLQNAVSFWAPLMKYTYIPVLQGAIAEQI
jgi:hypothetical protein